MSVALWILIACLMGVPSEIEDVGLDISSGVNARATEEIPCLDCWEDESADGTGGEAVPPTTVRDTQAQGVLSIGASSNGSYVCMQPGDEVTLVLSMTSLQAPVSGFQAFLRYDDEMLTCTSASYFLPDPFAWPLVNPILVEEGDIDASAGVCPFLQDPVQVDSDLVEFIFEATPQCGTTRIWFRPNDPPTRVSLENGTAIDLQLIDSRLIVVNSDPMGGCGCYPPDLNKDGRVNASDFETFDGCMAGPDDGVLSSECQCADFDADGDVDLQDYSIFQAAFANE